MWRRERGGSDEPETDEDIGVRVDWRDLVRVMSGHRTILLVALGVSLAGGALELTQPLVVTRTITDYTGHRPYLLLIGLLAVVFLAEAVFTALGHYLLERTGERIALGVRLRIIDRLLRWPMRRYHERRLGDLLSRTTNDATLLRDSLAYDLVEVGVGVFVIIGGIAMMIWLDATMFLLVIAIVGTTGALTLLLLRGIRQSFTDAQDNLGSMSAELERALSAIRTVRVLRAEDRESARIGGFAREAYRNSLLAIRRDAVINPAVTLAVHAAMMTVLVIGGLRVAAGQASLADLIGFLLYVTYVAGPLANLFDVFATLQRGLAALQRLEDVARIPIESEPAAGTVPARPREPDIRGEDDHAIEFRNVGFAFEPDRPVLRDVSFAVPHNSHVALVGPSGAGKSTIFALIARLYDPDTGQILIGGRDAVRDITVAQCRTMIGLVEQNVPLMHGTLRENIVYGKPEATEAEIDRAVELASLRALVRRLPDGLDTAVGEHGGALSGGEQQRVAIARALLPRPHLLLLDEPTAHLDAANEAALTRTIEQISTESTLLVIAHRPSTIQSADQIIVLDRGCVRAAGDSTAAADPFGGLLSPM
ncbi:ABC transporter ATP-binding protein [Nocardia sp. NPDC051570]|uniref:ABC transporter ATP-binding protein n=1 Tax=Nocardia sp. NPDC051570 TaxID=3364324 RepID=UPI0037B8AFB7